MKKVILIVPYFGKLPNYFQLWLNSCKSNLDIDWIVYTNDKSKYKVPNNVKFKYITFEEFRTKIQSKFDFKISLESPYKLCDYKPSYGYVLEEEIKEYKFWGYCDLDLIFGDLSTFFKEIKIEKYDKILKNGHLGLYKNNYENNRIFMKIGEKYDYKDVFSNNISFGFDESSIIRELFFKSNKKIKDCCNDKYLDIISKYKSLYFRNTDNKYLDYYSWEKNKVFRYYLDENKKINKKEYIYIHLQKRKMNLSIQSNEERFLIFENDFLKFKKLQDNDFKYKNVFQKIKNCANDIKWIFYVIKSCYKYKLFILRNRKRIKI